MNKTFARLLSVVLAVIMILSASPVSIFASDTAMNIAVSSASGLPGSEVSITIDLRDNPGISSMKLKLAYDDILTLKSIVYNTELGGQTIQPQTMASPATLMWVSPLANCDADATFATLTFAISESAEENTVADISVTYNPDDIYNMDEANVDCTVTNGAVTVITAIAGDINGDRVVNNKDFTRLFRYLADWDVTVNEVALDVNGDGSVNNKDATRLFQYLADWDVEITIPPIPPIKKCQHIMESTAAKAVSCTEDGNIAYWYCTVCDKYYSDADGNSQIALSDTVIAATGHTPMTDPAVPATYTSTGLTEGSHCSVCKAVIVEQIVIPILVKDTYSITYHIDNNDNYLKQQTIENPNPSVYSPEDGLKLANLNVPGYTFEGWYDGAGSNGVLVKTIAKGETGNIELYAKWTTVTYTVQFDSPDVPIDPVTYTVDKGVTLKNAEWYGYTFVGWSNDNGFIVNSIKVGTTGNITLHANWTSNRNRATSYSNYGAPIIIEDDINGDFLFVYNIGKIENVPLSQIQYIGNSQKIEINQQYTVTDTITSESAETIANVVSNATTKSSAWTLSEDWNSVYESGNEYDEQRGKTDVRTDSEGNTTGGNYYVSNSQGGSSYISTNSGGSSSNSSKVTKDNSVGINNEYQNQTEKDVSVNLGVKNETEVSAEVGVDVKVVDISAGISNTTTLSAEAESGRKDVVSSGGGSTNVNAVGTVDENTSTSHYDVTSNEASNWNTTSGYENSYQTSRNTEVSNAVSELISKKYTYSMSKSIGGENSATESVAGTSGRSDEYSSTLRYSQGNSTATTQTITYSSDRPGYYRLINAGTVHVFAVVGYDVATQSYYTYTYNVLDDERHTYLDYSKDNANFNDCENAIVAFEIPYYVNEYITGVTGKTDGIEFDAATGYITGYDGTDRTVIIPQYYSADNGDGTYTAVKVRGINADVFKGNASIKDVILPVYVTEIPDSAFEGCTALERLFAFGVIKIGDNAFKGCSSLKSFALDKYITSLGINAFEEIPEITVYAANAAVAEAAINSGAMKISVNISYITDSFDERKIILTGNTDYFALISNGATYNNLSVESDAKTTFISNMTIKNNTDTPLKISSANVILNRLTVENAPGFALILSNDNSDVKLYGAVSLSSSDANAVICKSISLSKLNAAVAGTLNIYGNLLYCGEISNAALLGITDGEAILITAEQYENYLTSSKVMFDANGGEAAEASKIVYYGQSYGELPVPTRDNYTFAGWYTAPSEGTQVTNETIVTALVNQTLYALWTPNQFTLTYNANGGSVTPGTKTLTFGDSYGELPVPTRDYFTFDGWFLADGKTKVTPSMEITAAADITIYAHWTENAPSGWVLASNVPAGAQTINRKWSYNLTSYTSSSSSWLNGWTHYDTSSVWSDYGGWSGWQRGYVGGNDSRQVETQTVVDSYNYKTIYHYYRYANSTGKSGSYEYSSTYYAWEEIYLDSPLTESSSYGGYKYWYNGSNYKTMWACGDNGSQQFVSTNYATEYRYRDRYLIYTYYFYKVDSCESASYPSGSNISNIQEWVQYRAK